MDFKDLLGKHGIDPGAVLVLRHTGSEIRTFLPGLAAHHSEDFNAYQQTQFDAVEQRMLNADFMASFIADGAARALFVGLYEKVASKEMTADEIRRKPAIQRLEALGLRPEAQSRIWFELKLREDFYSSWKGKLVVQWPGGDINYHRLASDADFTIEAIHPESKLDKNVPKWNEIDLTWDELRALPVSWWKVLDLIRGVYFIMDTSVAKGYVGSGSGEQNIGQRWREYAATGHGNNENLRPLEPSNFRFTILQTVGLETPRRELNHLEENWKKRLHTRIYGLNRADPAPDDEP